MSIPFRSTPDGQVRNACSQNVDLVRPVPAVSQDTFNGVGTRLVRYAGHWQFSGRRSTSCRISGFISAKILVRRPMLWYPRS